MVLKRLFGRTSGAGAGAVEFSIEDLIVLERYDDAIAKLEARTKLNPQDLHSHLRLAEVCLQVGKPLKAFDEFLFVADSYTDDGFYDKAIAVLTKAARLAPADETVPAKILRNQRLKELEHSRALALEGLMQAHAEKSPLAKPSLLEVGQIWKHLAESKLVRRVPGEQLKRLFAACELVDYPAGMILAEPGGQFESLLILVRGLIEVVIFLPGSAGLQVKTFTSGDIVGEAALFERKPFVATYRVVEALRGLRLDRAGLERALTNNPDPKALLDALREQHNDANVAESIQKLTRTPA